jgi:hypothetical protein
MFMQLEVHTKEIRALKFAVLTKSSFKFPFSPASSPFSSLAFDIGQEDKLSGLFPYEIKQMQAPFAGYCEEIPAADWRYSNNAISLSEWNWYLNLVAMVLSHDYISPRSSTTDCR